MRRLFWPMLTTIIFFSVMALWFCLGAITSKLTDNIEELLVDKIWATYDLDGRDVVIRGIAATENLESDILIRTAAIPGIASVTDEVIVPPLKSPFQLSLKKTSDTITVKGDFPVEFDRFSILDMMDGIVIDEAGNARGADKNFANWLNYAVEQIQQLQSGEVILIDNMASINGTVASKKLKDDIETKALPAGLTLRNITIKVE